jgi:pimeloyl-ACP methyl ester carboxylesterase
MFEPLFSRLSDRYHLVAPDYPGFGHSDWPDPKKFPYTFDHYAAIMNHFTEALGLSRYTLYMQDYGGVSRHYSVRAQTLTLRCVHSGGVSSPGESQPEALLGGRSKPAIHDRYLSRKNGVVLARVPEGTDGVVPRPASRRLGFVSSRFLRGRAPVRLSGAYL